MIKINNDGKTERYGTPISDKAKEFTFAIKTSDDDWAEITEEAVNMNEATMVLSEDSTNPDYYKNDDAECIDCMEDQFGTEAVKGFCICNAFKYLWRCQEKHETPIEDIKKSVWYLEKYLELSEND